MHRRRRAPLARVGALCLAGDDLPVDDRRLRSALRPLGLAADLRVRNDTFAVLRAGTERDWGIGVVCGTGMNCAGVAPDGRTVRFAAIGQVSGDDGGGGWVGRQAVRAAVRGHDGRDPHTALEREVPAYLGKRSLLAVLEGIQSGELDDSMPSSRRSSSAARPKATRSRKASSTLRPTRWSPWSVGRTASARPAA